MKFKAIVRQSSKALWLYSQINNFLYRKCNERETIGRECNSIFEVEKNSKSMRMSFFDIYPENNLYGMSNTLLSYAQLPIKCLMSHVYIEHGLFFGDYVARNSYGYKDVNRIVTFSEYRKEKLHQNRNIIDRGLNIYKIGPYIHYAMPLLPLSFHQELKAHYGKVLLVFPSHSIPNESVTFDGQEFINKILQIKNITKADTVIICLYWKDIDNKNLIKSYQTYGFHLVTAGHKHDPNFLRRLRSIIDLSDFTMSNDVGTNLGYCIHLGKPHYVFSQAIGFKEGIEHVMQAEKQSSEIFDSANKAKSIIANAFGDIRPDITPFQKELVDYYWGIKEIKTPEQIRKIYQ